MTNQERKLISAESVTEGHPDKVCDQISDEILDELLRQDPQSHVAVETSAATGVFLVFGEVTSKGYVDVQSTVRETLRRIGYTSSEVGLDADSCGVIVAITGQSAEINQGVARLTGEKRPRPAARSGTGPGRRRPGRDVRLRHRRDRRADAAADLSGPPSGLPPDRSAQVRRSTAPAPGRQDPG